LLVRDEPEICQPPNCWGRIRTEGAFSPTKAMRVRDTTTTSARTSLESFMKTESAGNDKIPLSLDYRGAGKVSRAEFQAIPGYTHTARYPPSTGNIEPV